jgi:thiol:disulfide interchange protein DsbC
MRDSFAVFFAFGADPEQAEGEQMKGIRRYGTFLAVVGLLLIVSGVRAPAFMGEGCSEAACADCHNLGREEAQALLTGMVDRVVDVRLSHVPGLYAVDVEKQARKIPVYLDFSKKFLITGDVIELQSGSSLTRERFYDLNRVDVSLIPLEDAVVIGSPAAPNKIVVFDDPECPYCVKLHPEMKKAVEMRPDVAFYIKMLPLQMHGESARRKAKAIICSKSVEMLDRSLAGETLPEPSCETDQIEQNEALAQQLGVRSTPTLILPDGRILPGAKPAEKILSYLPESGSQKAGAAAQ